MFSPEDILKKMIWKIKNDTNNLVIIASAILTGFFSYFYLMVDGYTCPDGIIEGVYYYINSDWALRNGRWAIRYLLLILGNYVVVPFLIVLVYCICVGVAAILLSRLWHISYTGHVILLTGMMVASPVVIEQLTYTYMSLAYSFALLFSVLYCSLLYEGSRKKKLIGIFVLAVSMGLYQSYTGAALMCVLFTLVLDLLNEEKVYTVFKRAINYAITFALAYMINTIEYKVELKLRNLPAGARLAAFDYREIFTSFRTTIPTAYLKFFHYFKDDMMCRKYLYMIFFAVIFFGGGYSSFQSLEKSVLSASNPDCYRDSLYSRSCKYDWNHSSL